MKKIHVCKICDRSFSRKSPYLAHVNSHSNTHDESDALRSESKFDFDDAALPVEDKCYVDEGNEKKLPICGLCNRLFSRFDLLSHHNVLRHPHLVKSSLNPHNSRNTCDARKHGTRGAKLQASKVCDICEKKFVSFKMLNSHMTKHLAYKCKICNRGFRVYSSLWNHAWVHTDAKPYVCTICGRGFGRLYRLRYHASIHSDDRPFKCLTCRKSFKLKGSLTKHKLSHKSLDLSRPSKRDHNKIHALKKIYKRKPGSNLLHHERQTKLLHLKASTFPRIKASVDCQYQDNKFAQYCSVVAKDCYISQMNGKTDEVFSSDSPKRLQFKAACEKMSICIAAENDSDMLEDTYPVSQPNTVRRQRSKKENIFPTYEELAVSKILPVRSSCANATDVNSSGHEISKKCIHLTSAGDRIKSVSHLELSDIKKVDVTSSCSKTRKKCDCIKHEKGHVSSKLTETSVNSMTDNDGTKVSGGETDCKIKVEGEFFCVLYKCATCLQVFKHRSSLNRHIRRFRHSYDVKFSVVLKKAEEGRKPIVKKSLKPVLNKGDSNNEISSLKKKQRRKVISSCSSRKYPLKVNSKNGSYQRQILKIRWKSRKRPTSKKAGSESIVSCNICGKQYKQQSSVYRHMRNCHPDDMKYLNVKTGRSRYGKHLEISVLEKREPVENFNDDPIIDSAKTFSNVVNEKAEKSVRPEIFGPCRKTDGMSTEKSYQELGMSTENSYQEQGMSTEMPYQEQDMSTEKSYQEQSMSTKKSSQEKGMSTEKLYQEQGALEKGTRENLELLSSVKLCNKSICKYLKPSTCLIDASNKIVVAVTDVTDVLCKKSCLKSQNKSVKKVNRKVSFCLDENCGNFADDYDRASKVAELPLNSVGCFTKASVSQSLSQQDITHSVDIPDSSIDLPDMLKKSNTEYTDGPQVISDCSLEQPSCSWSSFSSPNDVSVVSSASDSNTCIQTVPDSITSDRITKNLDYVRSDSQVINCDLPVEVRNATGLAVLERDVPCSEESIAENIVNDKGKKRSRDIKFKCKFCCKGYVALSSLKRHLKVHISTNLISTLEMANHTLYDAKNALKGRKALNPHQKLYKCENCERRYSSLRTLHKHTTKQTCQRPYECTFCKKRLKSKSILKRHMFVEIAKMQNKELTCENCEAVFCSKTDLELHKVDITCRTCGELIFCKYLYDTHSCQLLTGYLPRNEDKSLVVKENVAKYPSEFSDKEDSSNAYNAPGTSHFGVDVIYKSNNIGSNTYKHSYFSKYEECYVTDLPKFNGSNNHFLQPSDSCSSNMLGCVDLQVCRSDKKQSNCESSNSNFVCGKNVEFEYYKQNGNGSSVEPDCQSNASVGNVMQRQLIVSSQSNFQNDKSITPDTHSWMSQCDLNTIGMLYHDNCHMPVCRNESNIEKGTIVSPQAHCSYVDVQSYVDTEAFRHNSDIYVTVPETYKVHRVCGVTSSSIEDTYNTQQLQNLRSGSIMSCVNGNYYGSELKDDTQSVSLYPLHWVNSIEVAPHSVYTNFNDICHQCLLCGCEFSTASDLIDHEADHT